MWFKNCQLYQFTEPFALSAEELEVKLATQSFVPCKSIEAMRQGFIAPTGESLVHAANGFMLFCLQKEEKIVPGSVIRDMLNQKLSEFEKAQSRKASKKEKESFKEEITYTLITRAFSRTSKIYGYIDQKEGLLVIDTSSKSKAEDFTIALRTALGSLKIELPKVQDISLLLTEWVKTNQYPSEFTIGDSGVLTDKDQGVVRCRKKSFITDEFEALISDGCKVSELGLTYLEQLSFTLTEELGIKGIKFLEGVQDQAKDIFTESQTARFDANFTIMTETLRGFIKDLFKIFKAQ